MSDRLPEPSGALSRLSASVCAISTVLTGGNPAVLGQDVSVPCSIAAQHSAKRRHVHRQVVFCDRRDFPRPGLQQFVVWLRARPPLEQQQQQIRHAGVKQHQLPAPFKERRLSNVKHEGSRRRSLPS